MTRDEIMRMAREAGAITSGHPEEWDVWVFQDFAIERFANLVAAAEREACAGTVKEFLTVARFDHRHTDLGDVRLTVGDQEDLEAAIRARSKT